MICCVSTATLLRYVMRVLLFLLHIIILCHKSLTL